MSYKEMNKIEELKRMIREKDEEIKHYLKENIMLIDKLKIAKTKRRNIKYE